MIYLILLGSGAVTLGAMAARGLHEINEKLRELDFEERVDYMGEERDP